MLFTLTIVQLIELDFAYYYFFCFFIVLISLIDELSLNILHIFFFVSPFR